jgi:hypothetical protein
MPVSLRVYAYGVLSYVELFEDTPGNALPPHGAHRCHCKFFEPRNLTIRFSSA